VAGIVDGLVYRAAVYLILGDNVERALAILNRAHDLEPGEPGVLIIRMRVNGELGRYEESLRDCDAAIALAPDLHGLHAKRALLALLRGDALESVLRDLDEAMELFPCDESLLRQRATLLSRLGGDTGPDPEA